MTKVGIEKWAKRGAVALVALVLLVGFATGYSYMSDREKYGPASAALLELVELKTQIEQLKAEQEVVQQAREAAEGALKRAKDGVVKAVEITDSTGRTHEVPGIAGDVVKTESGSKLFRLKGASHMPKFTWKEFGRGIEFPVMEEGLVILGLEGDDNPPNIPAKKGYEWVRIENARFAGPFAGYVSKGILWGIQKQTAQKPKAQKTIQPETTEELIEKTVAEAEAEASAEPTETESPVKSTETKQKGQKPLFGSKS